jgi:spore coat polysaccharide biosynthesis protein SpsF (cytidylyltransferase family)
MGSVAIITARWLSTRLPGKMLADINGKPLLQWVVDRCRMSKVDEVVVATTESSQPIIDYCTSHKIPYYVGDEEDIVSRLHGAAVEFEADVIIRVWGDSPMVNPYIIDRLLKMKSDYWYADDGWKGTGAARLTFKQLEKDHKDLKGDGRHWYHKHLWPDYSVDDEESLQRARSILV